MSAPEFSSSSRTVAFQKGREAQIDSSGSPEIAKATLPSLPIPVKNNYRDLANFIQYQRAQLKLEKEKANS
jgi:hypothetical protein